MQKEMHEITDRIIVWMSRYSLECPVRNTTVTDVKNCDNLLFNKDLIHDSILSNPHPVTMLCTTMQYIHEAPALHFDEVFIP